MANNTLGEFSDGEDEWVFEIDQSTFLPQTIPTNTLGEFSDGEDDWVFEMDEDVRDNSEDDDDDLIRSIDEDEVLNQTGRGEKRKSDDQDEEPQQDYYEMETVRKHHSKKFGMTATDHTVRFNNVLHDVDLLESHERTHAIFHHLIEDVTSDMNPIDQVRFVLRSDQLQTPISIPFLPVEKLTTEKVLSHIEKVIQSNEDFRLNDTVIIDIIHVETPQGSGKSKVKRTTFDIREYLKKKGSVITINNTDHLCLARALSVAIPRIENDPKYAQIRNSKKTHSTSKGIGFTSGSECTFGPMRYGRSKIVSTTPYQLSDHCRFRRS